MKRPAYTGEIVVTGSDSEFEGTPSAGEGNTSGLLLTHQSVISEWGYLWHAEDDLTRMAEEARAKDGAA